MIPLIFIVSPVRAQQAKADTGLTGEYSTMSGVPFTFDVYRENNGLLLQIVGQGTTTLTPLYGLTYQPEQVQPKAKIEFVKTSAGNIDQLRWTQELQVSTWVRLAGKANDYAGDYQLSDNPYRILHVKERAGRLMSQIADGPAEALVPLKGGHFLLKGFAGVHQLIFKRDRQGLIHELVTSGEDLLELHKVSSVTPHNSSRENGFTRADTLLGMLIPLRSCYDVLFYDLDLTILPESKGIRGSNTMRFRAVHDFDRLQIDLHYNLTIDKILYHGKALVFTREYNAVYVSFPAPVKEGIVDSLKILYRGTPLEPDLVNLRGGIFWLWNRDKKFWIESVCQGVGANVWWPCKDHLSDRPDSMRISVTVPGGLTDISNGRLLRRTELPDGQTRFVWYVDYPIVTYDVAINIGPYAHFTDVYSGDRDTLALNFYTMPYNMEYAHWLFADVKRMLAMYEKDFGPYPFPRDGFNVMESIYPMEHQGAVSMGMMNVPFNSETYDSVEERRVMWHESSHEWWGNSVGCSDYADLWIHESFADYAEFLNNESIIGRPAAVQRLIADHPENKEPIIGVYNVNNFHTGDMYPKGALMLETLRDITDNDSLWFSIFRGIQARFRYQPVRTEDIVGYFNQATGQDYTYFFDQYLRYPHIPVLALTFHPEGGRLKVGYRWEADVAGFHMPVKVTAAKDSLTLIHPTTSWQTMELTGMQAADFKVDTVDYYVDVKVE